MPWVRLAVPALAMITLLTLIGAQARTAQLSVGSGGGAAGALHGGSQGSHGRRAGASDAALDMTLAETGRAPSIGGINRRESALATVLHLHTYSDVLREIGVAGIVALCVVVVVVLGLAARWFFSTEMLLTILYSVLYLTASPMAIMSNKILMKDKGFGYPVLVSMLGQTATAVLAAVVVWATGESLETGWKIGLRSLGILALFSTLSLVLGQYPYFYLTVAFIQMLKAFSPAYMIAFLFCLGIESPSRRVICCVLGLCVCTAIASAGEVNFSLVGVLFMTAASSSDALRLVLAQKLLKNQKMRPFEALVYVSPMCLLFMLPVALFKELPAAHAAGSFQILLDHPWLFIASGSSGFFVNVASFLLVKRTSGITLKLITMARNGGLVLVSALCFGETITRLEGIGYAGLLFFFAAYTFTTQQESAKTALKAQVETELTTEEEMSPLNSERGEKD